MVQHADHAYRSMADGLAVSLRDVRTVLLVATRALSGRDGRDTADGLDDAGRALHRLHAAVGELGPVSTESTGDVRETIALVHVGGDLQRLAELAQQIAETACARPPRAAPPQTVYAVSSLSRTVVGLVDEAARAATGVGPRSSAAVRTTTVVERELAEVGDQQRLLDEALVAADPPVDKATAVGLVLLGRCLADCARHAVSAAQHLALRSR